MPDDAGIITPPSDNADTQPAPEGVVVFDVEKFRAWYPEFEAMTDAQLDGFFARACLLLDNTPRSIVRNTDEREVLLYMLVCHLATLAQRGTGGAVGSVASATEGSVSASFAPVSSTQGSQWFNQTSCGAAFWQAAKRYLYGGRTYVQRTY